MKNAGFTIIELMVTLAIAGVLLGLGISSFNTMIADSQTKSVAESIMSGLRLARAEAIKRNVPMRFQLVSTLLDNCVNSASSALWVVNQHDPLYFNTAVAQGHCASGPYTPPDQADICNPSIPPCSGTLTTGCRGIGTVAQNPASCSDDPLIAFKSDQVSYPNVTVSGKSQISGAGAAAYAVYFNPLGRVYTDPNNPGLNFDTSFPLDRIDIGNGVGTKAWRIQISSASGSLRLCDPSAPVTSSLACPAQQ